MKNKRDIFVTTHASGLKFLRYTLNGKQISLYGKTKQECLKKYSLVKKENTRPERNTLCFLEWYEKWIQVYKSNLKEKTLKELKGLFNKHILPTLAKKPLKRITSIDIQNVLNKMQNISRQQTIAYIQIKSCFEQAYKINLIGRNPCLACVIKKNKGNKGRALTKEEQQKLLNYLSTHPNPVNTLVLIYLNTGMRCSELLNLNHLVIDREKNEIIVSGTKTKSSTRILQTSKQIIDMIPLTPKPFCEWNKNKVDREFKKITKALKFDKITIHSLRHTFATNCIENGVDMVVLQKWLGHASISMTIDRYTHISEDYKRQQQTKQKVIL